MARENTGIQQLQEESVYSLLSPLWSNYYQRVRKSVRFPRNYKEVSALECDGCDEIANSPVDNH